MSSELLQPVCKKLGLFWAHHFFSTLYSIFFQPYLIFLLKVAFIPPTSLILKIINGCINIDHSGVIILPTQTMHYYRGPLSLQLKKNRYAYNSAFATFQSREGAFPRLTAASVCPPAVCVARIGTALKLLLVAFLWCHEGGLRLLGAPAWGVSKHLLARVTWNLLVNISLGVVRQYPLCF